MRTIRTLAAPAVLALAACHPFAVREEPFTPDAAPVSEVAVVDGDTTYVLRTASYVLRARSRDLLWARRTLDDAAWRYRWLLGTNPPLIELRLDSADARPAARRDVPARRATNVVAPSVALRAARAWATNGRAPWWFEAGVQRLLVGTDVRATTLQRSGAERDTALPLAELLAAERPARVAAQGASLLLFLRERDPDALPVLAAALADGGTLDGVLARRPKLPQTLAALEEAWRKWQRRNPARGDRALSAEY